MSIFQEVRLRVVRMANDDGSNQTAVTPANVGEWLRVANLVYSPAQLRILFDPASDFETIRNTRLNQLIGGTKLQVDIDAVKDADAIAEKTPERVTVICRTSRSSDGGPQGNFAGYPEKRVVMGNFDPNALRDFAHELGHYLGLQHTFFWRVVQTVGEARVVFDLVGIPAMDGDAGDVSDTPPELMIKDLENLTDPSIVFDGKTIPFLRDNIMSYYRPLTLDAKTITAGQVARIKSILQARSSAGLEVSEWQDDWRWCKNCQGLFFSGGQDSAGRCPFIPRPGGPHVKGVSGNYALAHNTASFSGQKDWRWCKNCQGLFFADGQNSAGKCPGGGQHVTGASGDYALALNAPGFPGQKDWRLCKKCQGLFFSSAGKCPGGGAHTKTASGMYTLRHTPA
jgi:hypothetical protein